jgi:hypothetical protein
MADCQMLEVGKEARRELRKSFKVEAGRSR